MLRAAAGLLLAFTVSAQVDPPGFRPRPPAAHALVGARIFTQPDAVFSNGVVLIRDGRITYAGPELNIPADARVWDCTGLTIYPGFIDPYLALGTNRPVSNGSRGDGSARGEFAAAGGPRFFGVPGQENDPGTPGPGYGLGNVTPEHRVADSFVPDAKSFEALREIGFTAAHLVPTRGIYRGLSAAVQLGEGSPNELLLRADVAQCVAFAAAGGEDVYPRSLMGIVAAVRQAWFDAQHYAADQADHAKRPGERKRPAFNAALAALQAALVPTNRQAVFVEPGSVLMTDRVRVLAGELGWADRVIVSSGDDWRRPDLAARAGAPFIVPLALPALPKFPDEDAWESVSLDQLRSWDWAPENPAALRRAGREIALTTYSLGDRKEFRKNLRAALDRGLSETDALAALTTIPARLCGLADRLGTLAPGKLANLTVTDSKGYFDPEGKLRAVWIDGRPYEFEPAKPPVAKADDDKDAKEKADKKKTETRELARKRVAREALANRGVITNPPTVVIRNATIWTSGPQGILTNATLLLENGKIASVAAGNSAIRPPQSAFEVDGTGLHVTPGILDAHSHSMILGGVNEGTLPSTAMVRIGDVVNSETDNIHQQLAGGTTVVNLLHGSANPIGGQSQTIKLRDGDGPEELKFRNAPGGIKFALGENVKQANWGEKYTTRFPQTRMGVPTFMRNRFTAAQQYRDALKNPAGEPVRRDLELEALAEILAGQRLIHCHSYRQDEILAFLRTMESFGVRVGTLQHILEGYKVADEIAQHGAGASAFADWWGYKFEVIDAIPYAGSLMHARGVNVSFNSDSSDHARRLNFEAAKAVKYGGTPEAEALKFVTLNPAKQLGIDRWVGSLEPGKDADFVIWSGHPLDSGSVCLQTWIDGKKFFDRALEPARATALADERTALIAKAKKLAGEGGDATASDKAREKFFQRALEHAVHLGVVNCQDCEMPRKD
jgi:imidazolonepropionase-like amidohydrolase